MEQGSSNLQHAEVQARVNYSFATSFMYLMQKTNQEELFCRFRKDPSVHEQANHSCKAPDDRPHGYLY